MLIYRTKDKEGLGNVNWCSHYLKEISPGCSLEGLMLKLKLQYFGHLMRRADSLEKTLMLGKTEGRRKRGQQRMSGLDDITNSMDMGLGGLWELVMTGRPGMLRFMGSQRVGHDWETELNTCFILADICLQYHLPSLHIEPLFVSRAELSILEATSSF